MTTMTLELPDSLAQQLQQKHVSPQLVQSVAVAALEFWLANADELPQDTAQASTRFTESGADFARRLIQQNRALFEALAQR